MPNPLLTAQMRPPIKRLPGSASQFLGGVLPTTIATPQKPITWITPPAPEELRLKDLVHPISDLPPFEIKDPIPEHTPLDLSHPVPTDEELGIYNPTPGIITRGEGSPLEEEAKKYGSAKGFSRSSYVKLDEESKSWLKGVNKRIKELDEQLKVKDRPDYEKLKHERYLLSLNRAYLKKDQTTAFQFKKDYADFIAENIKTKIQHIPKSRHSLPSELSDKKVLHTNFFQVPILLQDKGIGSLALKALEAKAKKEGADAVALTEVLPEARNFYARNGYTLAEGRIAYKPLTDIYNKAQGSAKSSAKDKLKEK